MQRRADLLARAVAREEALIALCTAAAGGRLGSPPLSRVLTAAAADHRAHLEALHRAQPASSSGASPATSSGAASGASSSVSSSYGVRATSPAPSAPGPSAPVAGATASPRRTTPAEVATAETVWSADLLGLLPQAPPDLRRLLASVAASEAAHAALLRGAA